MVLQYFVENVGQNHFCCYNAKLTFAPSLPGRRRHYAETVPPTALLVTGSPYIMKDDDFEWDDVKAASNLRDHKVTFEMARDAFSDPFIVDWIDEGQDESEQRFAALGMVDGRLLFVAYTMRGDTIRIISARVAEPFERRKYHNENKT